MIIYSNKKSYENVEFGQYLSSPGYSHSFLKGERNGMAREINITDKITTGKIVDAIITEPQKVNMLDPLYGIAKNIAYLLKDKFPFIEHFKKQVSYSAIAEYKGFKLPVRGRLDFIMDNVAQIEMKITAEKNVKALIAHMGYKNQVWNNSKMSNAKNNFILIHSTSLKQSFLEPIDCSMDYNEFWAEKILKFGSVDEVQI